MLGWRLRLPVSRHFFVLTCVILTLFAAASAVSAEGARSAPAATVAGNRLSVQIRDSRAATNTSGPARCMVGIYLLSLHDFSFSDNTFEATFWMWTICPDTFTQPMDTLEFVNAVDIDRAVGRNQDVPNAVYRPTKVSGTFQHHWDLTDFPFDRQTLEIIIEDSEYTNEKLVYIPDDAQSSYHPDTTTGVWRIMDFDLAAGAYTYNTTFGDPSWVQGESSSDYSRLNIGVTIQRNAYTGFFKLTSVVYIAFLLSLVSFLIRVDTTTDLGTRLALVTGSLFAAAINMQVASNSLGNDSKLGLVDSIHLTAFAAIFFAAAVAIGSRLLLDMHRSRRSVRLMNYVAMGLSAVFFITSNALMIIAAAGVI
jgi:hypothetical protein